VADEPAIIAGIMTQTDPNVVPIPLSRARATEVVREIAKDSARWSVHIQYPAIHDWRRIVNRRQIQACLLEGWVMEDRASIDEHGNWRFRIARVCAGLDVVIDVALERNANLPRLFVVGITGDEI
jgi:hypothetical protein